MRQKLLHLAISLALCLMTALLLVPAGINIPVWGCILIGFTGSFLAERIADWLVS